MPAHDDGTVTLVRQYRAAVDAMVLEIPAGTRDRDGEAPEDTARRELVEEAGLEAAQWELLVSVWNSPGVSDQHTMIYLATGLRAVASRPDGVEEGYMTTERIRLADLEQLVADGVLHDETTVLGLYLARARLAAGLDGRERRRGGRGASLCCRGPPRSSCPGSKSSGDARRARSRPTGATLRPTSATSRRRTGHGIDEATGADAAAHLAALRGRTVRRRSPVRSRACAASTASWSRRASRTDDPTLDLPSTSVTDLLPKALSEEETGRLLGAVVGTGPAGAA